MKSAPVLRICLLTPSYTTMKSSFEGLFTTNLRSYKRAQAIIREPFQGPKDYKPKFRILLVRHGLSEANVDKDLYKSMSDHAIPVFVNLINFSNPPKLAPQGRDQAKVAGQKVTEYFRSVNGGEIPSGFRCRLWTSCYKRARETAEIIQGEAKGTQRHHGNFLEFSFRCDH
jgi:hypothetical protein